MALGNSLLNTVDKLLSKFQATDRAVYKRVVTRTGGDQLLGRPGTVSSADTLLAPQPAVDVLTNGSVGMALLSGATMAQIGDYYMTVSPNALSRTELQNANTFLVFKAGTAEEELQIISFVPMAVSGMDVAFEVLARSKKR